MDQNNLPGCSKSQPETSQQKDEENTTEQIITSNIQIPKPLLPVYSATVNERLVPSDNDHTLLMNITINPKNVENEPVGTQIDRSNVGKSQSTVVNASKTKPLVIVSEPKSLIIIRSNVRTETQSRSANQNKTIENAVREPPTLFLQALCKLNESSQNVRVLDNTELKLQTYTDGVNTHRVVDLQPSDISPPGSLNSAPPSYSFVLRQAAHRRPRFMGTFIPSPSFIQHTPPPNYNAAFDIYIDNPINAVPPRVHIFSVTPMLVTCPDCGYTGTTSIVSKITLCTHLSAVLLCLLCCWLCVPMPYIFRSCKDVYHYCSHCRAYLGMYCPTNPEYNNISNRHIQ